MEKKINLVCERRIARYREISEKALKLAKKAIAPGKEKEAQEIIKMVECYLSDSKYFQTQGHYVNAFAAINYAHGWLDCGARLGIFNIKNSEENRKVLSF